MKRSFARVAYWFESRLPRGASFQLAFVLLALAGLTVGGGIALRHLAGEGHPEPYWWAFLRLTDTGYLGDDSRQGYGLRVISMVLSLAGNLLLCGAMVAIFTTALDRYLQQWERGRGPLVEEGHFLILGWNERIPALIEELLSASARLGLIRPCIAILSPLDAAFASAELKRRLSASDRRRCRLLLRTGDPLEKGDLQRMDFSHARSILLVSSGGDRPASDLTLAKVVLTLRTEVPQAPEGHRATVIEVATAANKRLAESVGWPQRTRAIVTLEIVGRLLAQAVRQPGITEVYAHLLTDTFGESIFFVPAARWTGATLNDLFTLFPRAVPLGFLSSDGILSLADFHSPVPVGSRLVLMANSQTACHEVVAGSPSLVSESRPLPVSARSAKKVLVCGWNSAVPAFLLELAAETKETFSVTLASPLDNERLSENLARPNLSLRSVKTTLESSEALAALDPVGYDSVVLLGSEDETSSHADAETVMRCLLLQDLLAGTSVSLAVELKDEDNRKMLGSRLDLLVTDQVISHLLAQVAVEPDLLTVFEELFTRGGAEIHFEPLTAFSTAQIDFAGCQSAALRRQRIALGWKLASVRGSVSAGLHLNPARETAIQPEAGDILVTLGPGA